MATFDHYRDVKRRWWHLHPRCVCGLHLCHCPDVLAGLEKLRELSAAGVGTRLGAP